MEPMVHAGRSITLHRHGSVAIEVRIGGTFAVRWDKTPEEAIVLVASAFDLIDASPNRYQLMRPCWYRDDDPRRAEAERFHGVPLRDESTGV